MITNINWLEKGRRKKVSYKKRIVITVRKDGSVAFTFLNKAEEKVTKTGYVQVGLSDDRVYLCLREGAKDNGYKIHASDKCNPNFKIHPKESDVDVFRKFEGMHALRFDEESGAFLMWERSILNDKA